MHCRMHIYMHILDNIFKNILEIVSKPKRLWRPSHKQSIQQRPACGPPDLGEARLDKVPQPQTTQVLLAIAAQSSF